jgi:hypothetical protein
MENIIRSGNKLQRDNYCQKAGNFCKLTDRIKFIILFK